MQDPFADLIPKKQVPAQQTVAAYQPKPSQNPFADLIPKQVAPASKQRQASTQTVKLESKATDPSALRSSMAQRQGGGPKVQVGRTTSFEPDNNLTPEQRKVREQMYMAEYDIDPQQVADIQSKIAAQESRRIDFQPAPELTMSRVGGAFVEGAKDSIRNSIEGQRAFVDPTGAGLVHAGKQQMNPKTQEFNKQFDQAYWKAAKAPFAQDSKYTQSSGVIEDLSRGLGQVGVQLSRHALLGPAASVEGMYGEIVGGTVAELEAQGVSRERAIAAGLANASLQAPMEQLSLARIGKVWKPNGFVRKIRDLGISAGTNGVTEFFQKFPEAGAQLWAKTPDKTWSERVDQFKRELPETLNQAAYEGLLGFGIGAAAAAPGLAIRNDKQQHPMAGENAEARPEKEGEVKLIDNLPAPKVFSNPRLQEIFEEGRKQATERLQAKQAPFDQGLDRLYVNDPAYDLPQNMQVVTDPTEAELEEARQAQRDNSAEYARLSAIPNPTPIEKARMKELRFKNTIINPYRTTPTASPKSVDAEYTPQQEGQPATQVGTDLSPTARTKVEQIVNSAETPEQVLQYFDQDTAEDQYAHELMHQRWPESKSDVIRNQFQERYGVPEEEQAQQQEPSPAPEQTPQPEEQQQSVPIPDQQKQTVNMGAWDYSEDTVSREYQERQEAPVKEQQQQQETRSRQEAVDFAWRTEELGEQLPKSVKQSIDDLAPSLTDEEIDEIFPDPTANEYARNRRQLSPPAEEQSRISPEEVEALGAQLHKSIRQQVERRAPGMTDTEVKKAWGNSIAGKYARALRQQQAWQQYVDSIPQQTALPPGTQDFEFSDRIRGRAAELANRQALPPGEAQQAHALPPGQGFDLSSPVQADAVQLSQQQALPEGQAPLALTEKPEFSLVGKSFESDPPGVAELGEWMRPKQREKIRKQALKLTPEQAHEKWGNSKTGKYVKALHQWRDGLTHEQQKPERVQPKVYEPQSYHTDNTRTLQEKYAGRNDGITDITDIRARNDRDLSFIPDEATRKRINSRMTDRLLGEHGAVKFEDVAETMQELDRRGIPYVFERSDGGNLGGLNAKYGDVHARADKDLQKVWGEIYAQEAIKYGAVIGRDQGDEFEVVWPNYSKDEVAEIRNDIEQQMRNKAKELGLDTIPHPKRGLNGLPTGALYTNYGLVEGRPGKYRDMSIEADELAEAMKADYNLAKAKENGWDQDENGEFYEKGTDQRPETEHSLGPVEERDSKRPDGTRSEEQYVRGGKRESERSAEKDGDSQRGSLEEQGEPQVLSHSRGEEKDGRRAGIPRAEEERLLNEGAQEENDRRVHQFRTELLPDIADAMSEDIRDNQRIAALDKIYNELHGDNQRLTSQFSREIVDAVKKAKAEKQAAREHQHKLETADRINEKYRTSQAVLGYFRPSGIDPKSLADYEDSSLQQRERFSSFLKNKLKIPVQSGGLQIDEAATELKSLYPELPFSDADGLVDYLQNQVKTKTALKREAREADATVSFSKIEASDISPASKIRKGSTVSQIRSWLSGLQDRANNALPCVVVQHQHELPQSVLDDLERQGGGIIGGTYDPRSNKVYFVADNVRSDAHLATLWLHEQVGHHGTRSKFFEMFGPQWKKRYDLFLDEVFRFADGKKALERLRGVYLKPDGMTTEQYNRLLAEEYYTHEIAEKLSNGQTLTGKAKQLWNRFVTLVRGIVRRAFPDLKINHAEMQQIALRAFHWTMGQTDTQGGIMEPAGAMAAKTEQSKEEKARDYGRRVMEASAKWADVVEKMLKHEIRKRAVLEMGDTPDLLVELGAPNWKLTMRQKTFKKIAGLEPDSRSGHLHELTAHQIKELYAALADPVAVMMPAKNKMEIFVDMLERGNPVLVVLDLNSMEGRIAVNSVSTGFGHENYIGKLLGSAKAGNLVYLDKKIDALKDKSADVKPTESVASRVLQARQSYGKKIKLPGDVVKPLYDDQETSQTAKFRKLPPSGNTLHDQVDKLWERRSGIPKRSISEKVKDAITHARETGIHELTQGLADQFHALKLTDDAYTKEFGEVAPEYSAYIHASLVGAQAERMATLIKHGVPVRGSHGEITLSETGKGLNWAFEPVAKDLDYFLRWLVGERANKLAKEGRENWFKPKEIKLLRSLRNDQNKERYDEALKRMNQIRNGVLDFAQKNGLISEQAKKLWSDDYFYIPFYRINDEKVKGPFKKKGLTGQHGPHRLKGGELPIGDPLENLLQNFSHLIDASVKNHAASLAMDKLEAMDLAGRAPVEFRPVSARAKDFEKGLKDALGADYKGAKLTPVEKAAIGEIFLPRTKRARDIVSVMRNGRPVYYQVHDELALRALTAIGGLDVNNPIVKALAPFKRMLTWTVTGPLNLGFKLASYIRDTVAGSVQSKYIREPFVGPAVSAVKLVLGKNPEIARAMVGGAFFAEGYDVHDQHANAKALRRALKKYGVHENRILDTASKMTNAMGEIWHRANMASENATRLDLYQRALKKTGDPLLAAYEARNLLPFDKRGDWKAAQYLTSTVPFLNARIQGLRRLGQSAIWENRKGFAAGMAAIALSSILLHLHNRDDEEYQKLPDWMKDTCWNFFFNGEHYAIPKPFEVGLFGGTIPERIAEYFLTNGTDEKAAEKLTSRTWWAIHETLAFGPPVPIQWFMEEKANKVDYTGAHIVSPFEKRKAGDQRKPWTSETASVLAKGLDTALDPLDPYMGGLTKDMWLRSPLRMEHTIKTFFGTIGAYSLAAADTVTRQLADFPERPARPWEDTTLAKAMAVSRIYKGNAQEKAGRSQYTEDFYRAFQDLDELYAQIKGYQEYGTNEEKALAVQMIKDNRGLLAYRKYLYKLRRNIGLQRKQVYAAYNNREISAQEKQRQIELATKAQNAIAETGVKIERYYKSNDRGKIQELQNHLREQVNAFNKQRNKQ